MTWVKQSDRMWCDARFCNLSDGAQALWHRANSYLADQLLDGELPAEALRHLKTRKRYVDELVQAGYWIPQESGGWLAAGWQEFIQCKALVVARRTEEKQRLRTKRCSQVATKLNGPGPGPDVKEEVKVGTDTSVPANTQSEPAVENPRIYDQEDPPVEHPHWVRPKKTLTERVVTLADKLHGKTLKGAIPTDRFRGRAAGEFVKWCESAAEGYDSSVEQLAEQGVREFYANPSALVHGFPLKFLAESPWKYLGLPKGVTALDSKRVQRVREVDEDEAERREAETMAKAEERLAALNALKCAAE